MKTRFVHCKANCLRLFSWVWDVDRCWYDQVQRFDRAQARSVEPETIQIRSSFAYRPREFSVEKLSLLEQNLRVRVSSFCRTDLVSVKSSKSWFPFEEREREKKNVSTKLNPFVLSFCARFFSSRLVDVVSLETPTISRQVLCLDWVLRFSLSTSVEVRTCRCFDEAKSWALDQSEKFSFNFLFLFARSSRSPFSDNEQCNPTLFFSSESFQDRFVRCSQFDRRPNSFLSIWRVAWRTFNSSWSTEKQNKIRLEKYFLNKTWMYEWIFVRRNSLCRASSSIYSRRKLFSSTTSRGETSIFCYF